MVKKTKEQETFDSSESLVPPDRPSDNTVCPAPATAGQDSGQEFPKPTSNIDLTGRYGRAMLFNAKGTPLTDLGPNGSYIIEVGQWAIIPRDMVPDDGPVEKDVPTLIIWGSGREIYAFVNPTILARFNELIELEGYGPWEAPLTVEISSQTPRRGTKTTYSLRYIV